MKKIAPYNAVVRRVKSSLAFFWQRAQVLKRRLQQALCTRDENRKGHRFPLLSLVHWPIHPVYLILNPSLPLLLLLLSLADKAINALPSPLARPWGGAFVIGLRDRSPSSHLPLPPCQVLTPLCSPLPATSNLFPLQEEREREKKRPPSILPWPAELRKGKRTWKCQRRKERKGGRRDGDKRGEQ